jgi:hypothetical protein
MVRYHDAPLFCCDDEAVLKAFLLRYGIACDAPRNTRIRQIAAAFSVIPYENLTKIIKADNVTGPHSALRLPGELLADHLRWGTGGTCFSLTAAIIAVYDYCGIEAHPLLADRHYGPATHCGAVIVDEDALLLIDPGYLLFVPTPLPVTMVATIPLGYTTIELVPLDNGRRIELATVVRGSRKVRLVYKSDIVDAAGFRKAWTDSFTWEMMTYPVLTRSVAGSHLYVQGANVSVRNSEKTERLRLGGGEQLDFIGTQFGISRDIVRKAWGVIDHGSA